MLMLTYRISDILRNCTTQVWTANFNLLIETETYVKYWADIFVIMGGASCDLIWLCLSHDFILIRRLV